MAEHRGHRGKEGSGRKRQSGQAQPLSSILRCVEGEWLGWLFDVCYCACRYSRIICPPTLPLGRQGFWDSGITRHTATKDTEDTEGKKGSKATGRLPRRLVSAKARAEAGRRKSPAGEGGFSGGPPRFHLPRLAGAGILTPLRALQVPGEDHGKKA